MTVTLTDDPIALMHYNLIHNMRQLIAWKKNCKLKITLCSDIKLYPKVIQSYTTQLFPSFTQLFVAID